MGWATGAAVGVALPIGGITDGITDALTGAIGDAGVYAVFLLMLVDAVLPAGSEIVMLYAGALAAGAFPDSQVTVFGWEVEPGITAYIVMALAGTLGYLVGSLLGWGIGRYGGQPLLERHGRWFHVTPEKLARAERWFQRYEIWTVFVARMLPIVRSFVSIPAGIAEVKLVPYTVLTFLGTLPWCFGIAGAGYLLGERWETFHDQFRWIDYVIIALIVLAIAYLIFRAWRRRGRPAAEEAG
jgi:membrane protein DedA with SNARE-associated domain